MTDDRKLSEYAFSEMNFSFVNIMNLTKNNAYLEGHFRAGANIIKIYKAMESDGKVKLI